MSSSYCAIKRCNNRPLVHSMCKKELEIWGRGTNEARGRATGHGCHKTESLGRELNCACIFLSVSTVIRRVNYVQNHQHSHLFTYRLAPSFALGAPIPPACQHDLWIATYSSSGFPKLHMLQRRIRTSQIANDVAPLVLTACQLHLLHLFAVKMSDFSCRGCQRHVKTRLAGL